MSDKIINTFQQRRQIENAITELAQTETEAQVLQAVRALVQAYPNELVLQGLLRHLNTNDSQLRGGLGHLSTLLPPEETAAALRSAAANRQHDPAVRLNAAILLEKFLGHQVPPALLSDLQDTNDIAFQSLCEAVEAGAQNRYILLEYVTQMRDESEEIALMVLEQLRRLPAADRLELLRLVAQDDRALVAETAMRELEPLSNEDVGSELARTLHTLQFTLPPALAQRATRQLRKLQFSGTSYTPPSPEGWRALISPVEASGNQAVWLLYTPPPPQQAIFLNLVVNLHTGVLASYGNEQVDSTDQPSHHSVGELVSVSMVNNQTVVFLEAPFDYGRWLVQQALQVHWQENAWQPLFGEYTLYNDRIWQFDAPQVEERLQALVSDQSASQNNAPNRTEQPFDHHEFNHEEAMRELLEHPAMAGWWVYARLVLQAIQADARFEDENTQSAVATLLETISQWPDHAPLFQGFRTGLLAQAGWLYIAGSHRNAHYAHYLGVNFDQIPPQENPFLVQLFAGAMRMEQTDDDASA